MSLAFQNVKCLHNSYLQVVLSSCLLHCPWPFWKVDFILYTQILLLHPFAVLLRHSQT